MTFKIYKITCPHTPRIYIGMTSRDLPRRLREHRNDWNKHQMGLYNYCSSFELMRLGDCEIHLIEDVETESHTTVREREMFHIHAAGIFASNSRRHASGKPVHVCPCGGHFATRYHHQLTQRHRDYVAEMDHQAQQAHQQAEAAQELAAAAARLAQAAQQLADQAHAI